MCKSSFKMQWLLCNRRKAGIEKVKKYVAFRFLSIPEEEKQPIFKRNNTTSRKTQHKRTLLAYLMQIGQPSSLSSKTDRKDHF